MGFKLGCDIRLPFYKDNWLQWRGEFGEESVEARESGQREITLEAVVFIHLRDVTLRVDSLSHLVLCRCSVFISSLHTQVALPLDLGKKPRA